MARQLNKRVIERLRLNLSTDEFIEAIEYSIEMRHPLILAQAVFAADFPLDELAKFNKTKNFLRRYGVKLFING